MEGMKYGVSIADLIEELNQPKLYIDPPPVEEQEQEPQVLESKQNTESENEPVSEQPRIDMSGIAPLLTGIIDMACTAIVGAYALAENKTKYSMSNQEAQELEGALSFYFKNTPDFQMSPSTILTMTCLTIFAPKAITAFSERKENKEIKRLRRKLEEKNSSRFVETEEK